MQIYESIYTICMLYEKSSDKSNKKIGKKIAMKGLGRVSVCGVLKDKSCPSLVPEQSNPQRTHFAPTED